MSQTEPLLQDDDLRGRERSAEHLQDAADQFYANGESFDVELVDESISGVGVVFANGYPEVQLDQCVEVGRGEYRRDAIVQRIWTDSARRLRVGLQWRASHFVK
ncbi:MAG: hypothetical protein QGG36_12545 [Pirellulaceae bacterium]|jgi:hypothetical protein|nr:hypothetical protein [Pirellulaceae bacterium]MDP7016625.1 hypothetical protein [Pirellulaceae bacterium]